MSFKKFLEETGYDVKKLQENTWSAKRGRKLMKEIDIKYRKPNPTKTEGNKK